MNHSKTDCFVNMRHQREQDVWFIVSDISGEEAMTESVERACIRAVQVRLSEQAAKQEGRQEAALPERTGSSRPAFWALRARDGKNGRMEYLLITEHTAKTIRWEGLPEDAGSSEEILLSLVRRERFTPVKMEQIVRSLIEEQITVSTMESCTSGLLASGITDTEGASAIMKGAFVTYSNEAKVRQGVSADTIRQYGVYSFEVADEMADACRQAYQAQLGIGVTGTTGNLDPNNPDSIAGEIYYTILWGERACRCRLNLDTAGMTRHEVKEAVVYEVVQSLRLMLGMDGRVC